jgi:hypothetical protein
MTTWIHFLKLLPLLMLILLLHFPPFSSWLPCQQFYVARTNCVCSFRTMGYPIGPSWVHTRLRGTSKCRAQGCPTVDNQWTSLKDIAGKENFGEWRKEIRACELGHPSNYFFHRCCCTFISLSHLHLMWYISLSYLHNE